MSIAQNFLAELKQEALQHAKFLKQFQWIKQVGSHTIKV